MMSNAPLYSSSLAESTSTGSDTDGSDLAEDAGLSRLLLMKLMMSSFVLSPSYSCKLPLDDLK